jgi:hypothetical protein
MCAHTRMQVACGLEGSLYHGEAFMVI